MPILILSPWLRPALGAGGTGTGVELFEGRGTGNEDDVGDRDVDFRVGRAVEKKLATSDVAWGSSPVSGAGLEITPSGGGDASLGRGGGHGLGVVVRGRVIMCVM